MAVMLSAMEDCEEPIARRDERSFDSRGIDVGKHVELL